MEALCQDDDKGTNEMKEKATFNLSMSTLESLEDTWIHLKSMLKGEQRMFLKSGQKSAVVQI